MTWTMIGLVATLLIFPAAFADGPLRPDYYDDSCKALPAIVKSAVEEAYNKDATVAAGLIRLFYHDCFPQGCDASILLEGSSVRGSELEMLPNKFLRRSAVDLIEEIRIKVHAECGPIVSCADIMALATHDAVIASRGKTFEVLLGRLDSLEPAPASSVNELPLHTFSYEKLARSFHSRGLDMIDLVALSGAHTIGQAHCSSFADRFSDSDSDFVERLRDNCTKAGDRLQDLDVTTPDQFDDEYYRNLVEGKGVLSSDMELLQDSRASELIRGLEDNEWWFWNQFGTSMTKLGNLTGNAGAGDGEIRFTSCSVPNHKDGAGSKAAA